MAGQKISDWYSPHVTRRAINDKAEAILDEMRVMVRQGSRWTITSDVDTFLRQKLIQVSTFYQIIYRKESGWL